MQLAYVAMFQMVCFANFLKINQNQQQKSVRSSVDRLCFLFIIIVRSVQSKTDSPNYICTVGENKN